MTAKEELAQKTLKLMHRENITVEEATKRIFRSKHLFRPPLFREICKIVREMASGVQLLLF